jgi:hypothetical protein
LSLKLFNTQLATTKEAQSQVKQSAWLWHKAFITTLSKKAMDDFIVNNENKKHSSYGMKSFIL